LIATFVRLMRDPAKLDPACKALNAIAEALVTLGESAPEAYFAGVRHIQKEGSFGPPVDVASKLRGLCARGLVRCAHPDALLEAVTLLADPEVPARVGAVQALADSGSPAAELVLRLKALQGDDADVMGECFTALLAITPGRSVEFVANFLNAPSPAVIEAAALALGESRSAKALPLLQEAWNRHPRQALRKTILLAIALLRSDEAVAFLLMRRERDAGEAAADAEAALSLYHR
jgi:HEAT repeat protein